MHPSKVIAHLTASIQQAVNLLQGKSSACAWQHPHSEDFAQSVINCRRVVAAFGRSREILPAAHLGALNESSLSRPWDLCGQVIASVAGRVVGVDQQPELVAQAHICPAAFEAST